MKTRGSSEEANQAGDAVDTGIQDGTSIVESVEVVAEEVPAVPDVEQPTAAPVDEQEANAVEAPPSEAATTYTSEPPTPSEDATAYPAVPTGTVAEPTVEALTEATAAACEAAGVIPPLDEDLPTENERLRKEKAALVFENESLKVQIERLKAQVLALETVDCGKPYAKLPPVKSPASRGIKRSITGNSKLPLQGKPKGLVLEADTKKRTIKWDQRFEQLEAFQKEHGHVNLSKRTAPHDLSIWVNDQRTQHRLLREGQYSTMTAERIQRLRSLGFQFTVTKSPPLPWEERFQQLVKYKEDHNHCNVQQLCQASPAGLGNWVLEQRRKYKLLQEGRTRGTKVGTLTSERIVKLEELGFQWKLRDRNDKRTRKSDAKLTKVEHDDVLAAAQQLANAAATAPIAAEAAVDGDGDQVMTEAAVTIKAEGEAEPAVADPAAAFAAEAALEGVLKQETV